MDQRFGSSNNALRSETVSGLHIKDEKVKIVYDLFKTFFVNEYNSQSEFRAYLRTPEDLLLFYERSTGALVGFIILKKSSYTIDNHFCRIVEAVCMHQPQHIVLITNQNFTGFFWA